MLRTKVLLGAGAGLAVSSFAFVDESTRKKTISLVYASGRIASLVSCASLMTADYAYSFYYLNKPKSSDVIILERLSQAQTEIERVTIEYMKALKQEDKKQLNSSMITSHLREQISLKQNEIEDLSKKLAEINAERGDSFSSKVHTRNAIRLRDMCVRNKGVYIKLGQVKY